MQYAFKSRGIALAATWLTVVWTAQGGEWDAAIATVRKASPVAGANDEIRSTWKELAAADASALPSILRSMKDANPAAENWLRAAADAIAERTLAEGGELPIAELESLFNDTSASPRGRRVAYEWIAHVDQSMANGLLLASRDDPSLEIRYDAVEFALDNIESLGDDHQKRELRSLLDSARDLDQLKDCQARLEELGEEINLAQHMGFITSWRVVGPFDNTDEKGFAVAYSPERELNFDSVYEGKEGDIRWQPKKVTTDDELGVMDIIETLGPVKGAVAYATATFHTAEPRAAVLRYGSTNATKVWVNGKLAAEHEVYHAGDGVDQYVAPIELRQGANTILIKVCQNEQTESWAQGWEFQLRVTDELAGAIRSSNE